MWRAAGIQVAMLLLMTGLLRAEEIAAAGPRTTSNPMIHAEGTRLVDGSGRPIKLRGVLLEGWMMWGGQLWGAGLTSETKLGNRIEALVGKEEAARFRKAVYDSFITERDIEMIAELGLNVVRVPFNHTVLEKNGKVDSSAPGWAYLDRLLDWCEKHEVYVVLDLHAVPAGQSIVFVADPDPQLVWRSESDLQRTVDLWAAIAARYRSRTIVAGYDLINEPEPPKGRQLIDLYRRIITAIRAVDPHHLVFLTGTALSTDFTFYEGPLDANQAYTFHTYDFFTHNINESQVTGLAAIAEKHDVPLWNGEFGAHTTKWTAGQIALFEDPGNRVNGWIYWPWKSVTLRDWRQERFANLMGIESTKAWDTVGKYLGSIFGLKKIPKELALRALAEFLEASKAENLVANQEMVAALQSWKRSDTEPPPVADSPKPGGDGTTAPPRDDEFVDKRVVEAEYGFHLDLAGPTLGMPDVEAHREGDALWCEGKRSPTPSGPKDLYPRAPDGVWLVGITEDAARGASYQMMLVVQDKKGNASGPFHWEGPAGASFTLGGEDEKLQDWGSFVIQRLDKRHRVVASVTSNPLVWLRLKDRNKGQKHPECTGSIKVDYTTQCDIEPDAGTSCLARCKGYFRCSNLVKTDAVSAFDIYGDMDKLELVPTSVNGSFDLPLLWVNEDNETYWRGNRVYAGREPEDLPSFKLWRGGL